MSYSDLVREDRVHSTVFTDPAIFEAELESIFYGGWVYVGHESEVPESGDYCLKWIGREPLIMSRDEDGNIHLLINRCRHRGATVCQELHGNSTYFRCSYHGWTYSNSGDLVGVTFPKSYAQRPDAKEMGLTRVRAWESYRGFIFARMKPSSDGQSLDEFLGLTKQYIDAAVDASPSGKIKLSAGCQRTLYNGNWKYIGMDGYHPNFGHKSVISLAKRRAQLTSGQPVRSEDDNHDTLDLGNSFTGESPNRTEDLLNGHSRLATSINTDIRYDVMIGPTYENEHGRDYLRLLADSYGPDRVRGILVEAYDPHVGIYPNLEIINSMLQVKRPISVDQTEITIFPILLDGVPDKVNEDRIRTHEWFYGVASFGTSDDTEMFERMHQGLQADVNPWVLVSRGLGNEKLMDDGRSVGHITDEVPQRAMMRRWAELMDAAR